MEELEQILRSHSMRYPQMQPADAVKLIYQNEFGGGHLIRDEEAALRYLNQEYEAVEKDLTVPRCEEIGNGIVRVYLAALTPGELKWLGQEFIRSAKNHQGELQHFVKKLAVLRTLTEQGIFSFSSAQLVDYLAQYEKAGYPMVSHSEVYRKAYNPAYRIILDRGEKKWTNKENGSSY